MRHSRGPRSLPPPRRCSPIPRSAPSPSSTLRAMTEEERRAAVVKKTAVLELPGMDAVEVRRDLPYGDGDGRRFDLYLPPGATAPVPLVLFVYGFPDPRFAQGLRTMGAYSSWGR